MSLATNYKDDILATSMSGKRRYNLVDENGNIVAANVHIEDVSQYTQIGDNYGSDEINAQNEAINNHTDIIGEGDISDIGDGTITGAISQLNSDLGSKSSASAVTGNDAFSKIATLNNDLSGFESEINKKEPIITEELDGWIGRLINIPIPLGSKIDQTGGLLLRVNFSNGGNDNIYVPLPVLKYATTNMKFSFANVYMESSKYYGRAEVTFTKNNNSLTLTYQEKGSLIGDVLLDVYIYS